ncbi:MAG: hypothetical protein LBC53_01525 [Spirochaetaceae bacterium]|nr:hypothetical protein [Spirochaetaceae bacterium]
MNSSLKNKAVAFVLLVVFSGNVAAQNWPDVKGFDRGVFDHQFDAADREITPEKWMEQAKNGLLLAKNSWERLAGTLFTSDKDFKEALKSIDEWSEEELEIRYAQWIENRFLRDKIAQSVSGFEDAVQKEFKGLYYHIDEYENIILNDINNDPEIIRPEERDLEADAEYLQNALYQNKNKNIAEYANTFESLFPELTAFVDKSKRENLIEKFESILYSTSKLLERELCEIIKREERIFFDRRIADSYSLRNKSESEAASAIVASLIYETETFCNQRIAELEARIEEASAGTGDLAIYGKDWLEKYQEQFTRGLKAWEDAENRFFMRRIEWEQEAAVQWSEGEDVWAEAFNKIVKEQQAWEDKAKQLFDSGERLFKDASLNLNLAIEAAKEEFAKDAQMRVESGKIRAEAYLKTYLTSAGIAASAQESVDYWMESINTYGQNPPKIADDNFNEWFNNLRVIEINILKEEILNLEEENSYYKNISNIYTKQLLDLNSNLDLLNKYYNNQNELDLLEDYNNRKKNNDVEYDPEENTEDIQNLDEEYKAFMDILRRIGYWMYDSSLKEYIASCIKELENDKADVDKKKKLNDVNVTRLNQIILDKQKKIIREDSLAETEIKRWLSLYKNNMEKAISAREALLNDFDMVMGDGLLADVLAEGVSSEDFNLDEYQVELLRAQAVSAYWNKRLEIAKAVNDYALDLSSARMTEAEGILEWEKAKSNYDKVLKSYEEAQKALSQEAQYVQEAKNALSLIQSELREADAKLDEMNEKYSFYGSLLKNDSQKYLLEDIQNKYNSLLENNNMIFSTKEDSIYKNYITKAYELGYAQRIEAQGRTLKRIILGDENNVSLEILKETYDSINIPEDKLYENIEDYGIKEDDTYYNVISYYLYKYKSDINNLNELNEELILIKKETEEGLRFLKDIISSAQGKENNENKEMPGNEEYFLASTEEIEKQISELEETLDSCNEWNYDAELEIIESGTRENVLKAVNLSKTIAKIRLESRLAALRLITAESTKKWYAIEKNMEPEDAESNFLPDGLYVKLKNSAVKSSDDLNDFLETYNTPENTTPFEMQIFYAGDLLVNYEIENGLLGAYHLAQDNSDAILKEESELSIKEINNIFNNYDIDYSKNKNENYNIIYNLDIIKINESLLQRSNENLNALETAAKFIYELKNQFDFVPLPLYNEFTKWINVFIEYYAANVLFNNIKINTNSQTVYNLIFEKLNKNESTEYLNFQYLILVEYEKQKTEQNKQEKNWRQYLTKEYVGSADVEAAKYDAVVKAASSYSEGLFFDVEEKAVFYTNVLNGALNGLNDNIFYGTSKENLEFVNAILDGSLDIWNENQIIYTPYSYLDAFYSEEGLLKSYISKNNLIQNDIKRLSEAYDTAKSSSVDIQKEMNEILENIHVRSEDVTLLNQYISASNYFKTVGDEYDDKYTNLKQIYETLEKARFEYEKQDAIRRWASTSYLDSYESDNGILISYATPAVELALCLEKSAKANVVLAALEDLYNDGEKDRKFNDPEYQKMYFEYKQSFDRMMFTIKIRDELNKSIKEETIKNEKLYEAYQNYFYDIGGGIAVDSIKESSFEEKKDKWTIADIITIDEDGRLIFNKNEEFFLSGQSAEGAALLKEYFSAASKQGDETYASSNFEAQVRDLTDRIAAYLVNVEKYKQWSLARDYLIKKLNNENNLSVLGGNVYKMDDNLRQSTLASMKADWGYSTVSKFSMTESSLFLIQEHAWENLSEAEKKDLEFYIILDLMGGGGKNVKKFSGGASSLKEYEYVYDRIDKNYENTLVSGIILTACIIHPMAVALGIVMLASLRDIDETRSQLNDQKSRYKNVINMDYTSLKKEISDMNAAYESYSESCNKLAKMKGVAKNGEKIEWDRILLSLQTAGITNKTTINSFRTYWNEMNVENKREFNSSQEAVTAIAQWAKNKRLDAKSSLERAWDAAGAAQNEAQAAYRNNANLFIDGAQTKEQLDASAKKAFGENAASLKTHIKNEAASLIGDIGGMALEEGGYSSEYGELASEITDLIGRAYYAKYAAELYVREVEWNLQASDINQKYMAWKNASAVILALGREDWKKSVERIQESYAQWRNKFIEEYKLVNSGWDGACLIGLQEKEAWISSAAAAAGDASNSAILDSLGVEAENLSRVFDARDPYGMNVADAQTEASALLKDLFNSAGISGLETAFSAVSNAASAAASKVRTGIGGGVLWDSALVSQEAELFVRNSNKEIAEREAKRLAENVRRTAENAVINVYKNIEYANANFDENMNDMFIYDGRWDRRGNKYVKDVMIDSTIINGIVKERAELKVYEYYKHPEFNYKKLSYLDPEELDGLEAYAINALIARMQIDVKNYSEEVFGSGEKENQKKGAFDVYIGEAAEAGSNVEPEASKWELFAGGKTGNGELGRLLQDYIYWNFRETNGVSAMNAPLWDKSLWHKNPDDWFDPPTIKGMASIALQVAASVAGGGIGGALVGLIDDYLYASLDLMMGKNPELVGLDFAKELITTGVSLGASWGGDVISSKVGGLISKTLGNGTAAAIASASLKATVSVTNNAVNSGVLGLVNSAFYGAEFDPEKVFSASSMVAGAVTSFTSGLLDGLTVGGNLSKELYENTGKATGLSLENVSDMQKFNGMAGGIAGQAANVAMGGDFTLNIAAINGVGALEVHLGGERGFSMNAGSGGVNVSYSAIAAAIRGLDAIGANIAINEYVKENDFKSAIALRAQYAFGDKAQKQQLRDILNGDTIIELVESQGQEAETIMRDGKRVIQLAGFQEGESAISQLRTGITLGHEAYRDGVVDDNNNIETQAAVLGHTAMAARMNLGGYDRYMTIMLSGDKTLTNDLIAYRDMMGNGIEDFNQYVDKTYDSSADFWKVMKNGDLFDDGNDGVFTYEDGRKTVYTTSGGKQGSLEEFLGLKGGEKSAYELLEMREAGFVYENGAWSGSGGTISYDKINNLIKNGVIKKTVDPLGQAYEANHPATQSGQVQKNDFLAGVKDFFASVSDITNKALSTLSGVKTFLGDKILSVFSPPAAFSSEPTPLEKEIAKAIAENNKDGKYLTDEETYNKVRDIAEAKGLIGKDYGSTDVKGYEGVEYLCTHFVEDMLTTMGVNSKEYISSLKASDAKNGISGVITPEYGETPAPGLYVFYKEYENKSEGSGHVGFVLYGDDGSMKVLHNGGKLNKVQEVIKERKENEAKYNLDTYWYNKEKSPMSYKPAGESRRRL